MCEKCGRMDHLIGDDPDADPEWEWVGKDGLTDKQREQKEKDDDLVQSPGVGGKQL